MAKAKHIEKIGIMGGTFDPVHNGHLAIAQSVAQQLELDQVLFIPTGNPHFKQDKEVTPATQRAQMVRLALQDSPGFVLDCCEVERPGITFTADTLEELTQRFDQAQLFFIMGTDSAISLPKWRRAQDVARLCTVVVAQRPGQSTQELREALDASPITFDIRFMDVPQLDISSTNIRERVARGDSIADVVPAAVAAYIADTGLYTVS